MVKQSCVTDSCRLSSLEHNLKKKKIILSQIIHEINHLFINNSRIFESHLFPTIFKERNLVSRISKKKPYLIILESSRIFSDTFQKKISHAYCSKYLIDEIENDWKVIEIFDIDVGTRKQPLLFEAPLLARPGASLFFIVPSVDAGYAWYGERSSRADRKEAIPLLCSGG